MKNNLTEKEKKKIYVQYQLIPNIILPIFFLPILYFITKNSTFCISILIISQYPLLTFLFKTNSKYLLFRLLGYILRLPAYILLLLYPFIQPILAYGISICIVYVLLKVAKKTVYYFFNNIPLLNDDAYHFIYLTLIIIIATNFLKRPTIFFTKFLKKASGNYDDTEKIIYNDILIKKTSYLIYAILLFIAGLDKIAGLNITFIGINITYLVMSCAISFAFEKFIDYFKKNK